MKKLKCFISFFVLLILISACHTDQIIQPYYLLTENTCTFPCWMGITPGETPYAEVKDILEQLRQKFLEKNVTITIKELPMPGDHTPPYTYVEIPGSEIYIVRNIHKIVDEIRIYFVNTPTVSEFVQNYKAPDSIGICLGYSYAQPYLVYDGAQVLTRFEMPDYDSETDLITFENFYESRVNELFLVETPIFNHFDFTFSWEDMAQTVVIDIKQTDPDSDCYGEFVPWK